MNPKPVYYFSKHNENSIKLLGVLKNYNNLLSFICVEDYYSKHQQMPSGCRGCPSLLVYDQQTNRPQMYEGVQRIQNQLNSILSTAVATSAPSKVPEVPKFLQHENETGKEQFDWATGVAPAPLDGSYRPSEIKAPFTIDVKKGSDNSSSNAEQLKKYQEASAQYGISNKVDTSVQSQPELGNKSGGLSSANSPTKSNKSSFFAAAK